MNIRLILIGGGGHCKSVIEAAEGCGYEIVGILDVPHNVGKKVMGIPIIGTDNEIANYIGAAEFVITVGFILDPNLRILLFEKVKKLGGALATIIASTAHVSKYAQIGEGSVILHQAVVNAEAIVGVNSIINTFANIEHETIIGNHTHISTGVMVNGDCRIGNAVFIGSQSVVRQMVKISDYTIVSAGSFVNKDILEKGVYIGNPARKIK